MTDRRADSAMATVLGDEYRRIVADSRPQMWRNIERSAAPTTLEEWKVALARHWSAERTIENMNKQLRPKEGAAVAERRRMDQRRPGTWRRPRRGHPDQPQCRARHQRARGRRARHTADRSVHR